MQLKGKHAQVNAVSEIPGRIINAQHYGNTSTLNVMMSTLFFFLSILIFGLRLR